MIVPVPRIRAQLLESGTCTEQQLTQIDNAAREEVEQAMTKAQAAKPTPREETLIDVYADASVPPRRGHYPRREAETTAVPTGDKPILMLDAIRDAQDLALTQDKGVFLLGEDIGDPPGGVCATSKGLQTKHGPEDQDAAGRPRRSTRR